MSDAESTSPPASSGISGKYVILVLLILGLAGAGGALWYFAQSEQQAREWLTQPTSEVVLKGDGAIALLLVPPTPGDAERLSETLLVGQKALAVQRRVDVIEAPQFQSLRQSLLKDASYNWEAGPDDCDPGWPYGLRFSDENAERDVTILFDFQCKLALVHPLGTRAVSIEPIAPALEAFFKEQLPPIQAEGAGLQ